MSLMFDSPLGKKLTESETVIAELVVEDITAWLHEQKLPLYVALSSVSLNLLVLFARSARVRANPKQAPEFVKSSTLTDYNAFTTSVFI